ncbi:ribosome biogenesis factor YjgA [Paraglaciecola sp. L3A3]|uniref:ribosome biogenesis factor YjgA n=1 Tax=Paraglaciecola sp. L3A3 TaxID=2686358 RepID=UPI00131C1F0C|nr:ribosome biogenesis factor YjgA [Paraglaciecola sp. L3A3]
MVAPRKNNPTEDSFDIEEDTELLSKTQIKAQADELQKLGTSLVHLGPSALAKIPMDTELLDAIMLARRIMRKKEGYRRQLQLIGKLMRNRDVAPIEQALLTIKSSHKKATNALHKIEELRDTIIIEGDSKIESTLDEYPLLDRQKLRQLFRQAQKQQADNKPPKASRELFKYLKDVIIG